MCKTNKQTKTLTGEATGKTTGKHVTNDPLSRMNDTLSGLGKGRGRWEPDGDGGDEDALCGG